MAFQNVKQPHVGGSGKKGVHAGTGRRDHYTSEPAKSHPRRGSHPQSHGPMGKRG